MKTIQNSISYYKYGYNQLLEEAINQGDEKAVSTLLEKKANPNIVIHLGTNSENYRYSPLMLAAKNGCTKILKKLIDAKANPNQQIQPGQTALMYAVAHDHLDCVKLLIEAKADVNTQISLYPVLEEQLDLEEPGYTVDLSSVAFTGMFAAGAAIALASIAVSKISKNLHKPEPVSLPQPSIFQPFSDTRETVLSLAARHNCREITKFLLNNTSFQSEAFLFALYFARLYRAFDIVKSFEHVEKISFLAGTHQRLGAQSSISLLVNSPLYEPKLLTMVMDFCFWQDNKSKTKDQKNKEQIRVEQETTRQWVSRYLADHKKEEGINNERHFIKISLPSGLTPDKKLEIQNKFEAFLATDCTNKMCTATIDSDGALILSNISLIDLEKILLPPQFCQFSL